MPTTGKYHSLQPSISFSPSSSVLQIPCRRRQFPSLTLFSQPKTPKTYSKMRFDLFAVFALAGAAIAASTPTREGFEVVVKRQRPPVGQPAMAGPDGVVVAYNAANVVKSNGRRV
jgi:hypothetical protein